MFQRIIFLQLIVSSLFRNFNRCAGCFQSRRARTCKNRLADILPYCIGDFGKCLNIFAKSLLLPLYHIGADCSD